MSKKALNLYTDKMISLGTYLCYVSAMFTLKCHAPQEQLLCNLDCSMLGPIASFGPPSFQVT